MVYKKALVKLFFIILLTETGYYYCRDEWPRIVDYHDTLVLRVGEPFFDGEYFLSKNI
jgi:hypothetical protein